MFSFRDPAISLSTRSTPERQWMKEWDAAGIGNEDRPQPNLNSQGGERSEKRHRLADKGPIRACMIPTLRASEGAG